MRILWRVLYWLAVVLISLALVVGLILFFEARDDASLDSGARPAPGERAAGAR